MAEMFLCHNPEGLAHFNVLVAGLWRHDSPTRGIPALKSIAPFILPELEWGFRNSRLLSINASGHKYGLVYPEVSWILWCDKVHLPDGLVFHVGYPGGDLVDFSIDFSRPGNTLLPGNRERLRCLLVAPHTDIQGRIGIQMHIPMRKGDHKTGELVPDLSPPSWEPRGRRT